MPIAMLICVFCRPKVFRSQLNARSATAGIEGKICTKSAKTAAAATLGITLVAIVMAIAENMPHETNLSPMATFKRRNRRSGSRYPSFRFRDKSGVSAANELVKHISTSQLPFAF
jgi:hypothetical protein